MVLFLYQLELDSQLQRMLTYENFDNANDIRKERERIERFSGQLQVAAPPQSLLQPSCMLTRAREES